MRAISLSAVFVTAVSVFVFVSAYPTADNEQVQRLENSLSELYDITPDETQDSILAGETTTRRRIKRSDIIGFIRQICPPLADFINNIFQRVKKLAFQVVGKLLFQNNGPKKAGGEKPRVKINLPTYPADEEDEDTTSTESVASTETGGSSSSSPPPPPPPPSPSPPPPSPADSSSSTESSSSESSQSKPSALEGSSAPSDPTAPPETTSSAAETTSSSTETHSNSISTNELLIDDLDLNYENYDC